MTSVERTVVVVITILRQSLNGSPVYPAGHRHMGWWFCTTHSAFGPHEPGHGSIHFSLRQALLLGHSALMEHSGLQLGGTPM